MKTGTDQVDSRIDWNEDGCDNRDDVYNHLDCVELPLHRSRRDETHHHRAEDGDTTSWKENEFEDLNHLSAADDVV